MLIMNIEEVTEIEITVAQRTYRREEGRRSSSCTGVSSVGVVMSHICSSFLLLGFLFSESLEEGA